MAHEWRVVRVIGEHRVSNNDRKDKYLQLARYARDGFSAQPARPFIHACNLLGMAMELWVFHRGGAYSSGAFDIYEEPEEFFQAFTGYKMMNDDESGLDNLVQEVGGWSEGIFPT